MKTGVLGTFLEVGKKTLNLQQCSRNRHQTLDVSHFTLSERLFFAYTLATKKGTSLAATFKIFRLSV